MSADAVGHCFADRDIRNEAKEGVLNSIVPTDSATRVLQPGLMNNEDSFPQEQRRDQTAEANVVLKKQIAPTEESNNFENRWSPGHSIIPTGHRIARRLGNHMDFIAGSREFFGQNLRDRFNSADARIEEIRRKKNLHVTARAESSSVPVHLQSYLRSRQRAENLGPAQSAGALRKNDNEAMPMRRAASKIPDSQHAFQSQRSRYLADKKQCSPTRRRAGQSPRQRLKTNALVPPTEAIRPQSN